MRWWEEMEREQITRRVAPLVFTPQHPGGTGTGNLPKGTEKTTNILATSSARLSVSTQQ